MAVILRGRLPRMRERHVICKLLLRHEEQFYTNLEFKIDGIFGEENLDSCMNGWKKLLLL